MRAGWVCSLRISCRGPVCGQVWNLRKKRQDTEGITAAPPPRRPVSTGLWNSHFPKGVVLFFSSIFHTPVCMCLIRTPSSLADGKFCLQFSFFSLGKSVLKPVSQDKAHVWFLSSQPDT